MARFLILILCGAGVAAAAGSPAPGAGPAMRPPFPGSDSRIGRFADELFDQGEYFRAGTEYLRLLSYEPGAPDAAGEIEFRIALCSYRARRYDEAARRIERIAARAASADLKDRCRIVQAAALHHRSFFPAAHRLLEGAMRESPPSAHLDRLAYLDGLTLMKMESWNSAGLAFSEVPEHSTLAASAADLAGLARRAAAVTPRRPWMTASLSAVVPGLGQVVSGYHWDGLSALVLSGAGLAVAVAGHREDRSSLRNAGIVLFGLWYSAGVYGGYAAARRYNRQTAARVLSEADALNSLSLD